MEEAAAEVAKKRGSDHEGTTWADSPLATLNASKSPRGREPNEALFDAAAWRRVAVHESPFATGISDHLLPHTSPPPSLYDVQPLESLPQGS